MLFCYCGDGDDAQRAWFAYFDEDNSGELSQAEVVRGLIKSFRLGSDLRTVQEMKDTVREKTQIAGITGKKRKASKSDAKHTECKNGGGNIWGH